LSCQPLSSLLGQRRVAFFTVKAFLRRIDSDPL
jgi:hypothetical protein